MCSPIFLYLSIVIEAATVVTNFLLFKVYCFEAVTLHSFGALFSRILAIACVLQDRSALVLSKKS
jgi:hypothetical protein